MKFSSKKTSFLVQSLLAIACMASANVWALDAASQMAVFAQEAKTTPSAAKGETFFNTKHGGEWSCSSCHGTPPTGEGKHASTSKPISALAPAITPTRFTDQAKSDKWFKRNCNDVMKRECTAGEKADVLAYLISLKK